jgi:hypothetical protein
MITFSCPGCQKKLSVKDELAGKKARCPACGRVAIIPVPSAVPTFEEIVPPLPSPQEDQADQRQRQDSSSIAATLSPSSTSDATPGAGRADPCLTDFLAPPRACDELGRLGSYRVLNVLGHGGMGVVFKAEDPRLKRLVALKAMLPSVAANASAGQRFLREAQAMAAVKHDHVATIYQVDEESGVPFLAMEFLAGEPLEGRLGRDGKLPLPEVLRIGREIAEGLDAAHATGLTHRDVKPANVWLEAPRGRVKILDFGLARATSQDAVLTQQGMIVGTPAYMAPEQARGEKVDARSDLFSLGCVLYRMLTGQMAFHGKDILSTLLAVGSHQPARPDQVDAGVPRELSELVMRLLEKEADRRPGSASEVAGALRVMEVTLACQGTPRVESTSAGARVRRKRSLLVFAAALLAVVPLGWWLTGVLRHVQAPDTTPGVKVNDEEPAAHVASGAPARTDPVTATPGAGVKTGDPDRRAAEWVLSVGGGVRVNGQEQDIRSAAELPGEPFRLTFASLRECKHPIEPGLAHFEGCKDLTHLDLSYNRVSDSGLAHFKGCKKLTFLELLNTGVGNEGIANFRGCKGLKKLVLVAARVSDSGLACFEECKGLTHLDLGWTMVGDVGLAHFKGCKDLTELDLIETRVGDAALAQIRNYQKLLVLRLDRTKVTDEGLAQLKDCKRLTLLGLENTQVSQAGLAHVTGCKGLTGLGIIGTKVTDLSLLKGFPLKSLSCDYKPERDAEILRSIKTLEELNYKPTKEVLK